MVANSYQERWISLIQLICHVGSWRKGLWRLEGSQRFYAGAVDPDALFGFASPANQNTYSWMGNPQSSRTNRGKHTWQSASFFFNCLHLIGVRHNASSTYTTDPKVRFVLPTTIDVSSTRTNISSLFVQALRYCTSERWRARPPTHSAISIP